MKRIKFLVITAILSFMTWSGPVGHLANNLPLQWESDEIEDVYDSCIDDLVTCIALVEGYADKPYFCGARWTFGYGTTADLEGKKINAGFGSTSQYYAKKCVVEHLDREVKPYILQHLTRKVSKAEMLGICLFVYNVGGANFSGYTVTGEKIGEPSEFLKALNRGETPWQCCRKMTGFRSSAGKQANGLLKRHWVQSAIFMGYITPKEVKTLEPVRFYNDSLEFYYRQPKAQKDDFWTYDFSKKKIREFLNKNRGTKTNAVAAIV